MPTHDDAQFSQHVCQTLAQLNGVHAVALGGSRATKTHTPDSDWDFALYYRNRFNPADLRAIGWPGEVSEIGGWGGGVFNGGAWVEIDQRRVDIHYRDLDDVEYRIDEAHHGRFDVELLPFHRAGIPTYLVVAELATARVLHGELPRPHYPDQLRRHAPQRWQTQARLELLYGRNSYARRGNLTGTAGAIATAATQTAHAVMAARSTWVTNEKRLLDHAGLRHIDTILTGLDTRPATLTAAVDAADHTLQQALDQATT